MKKSAIYTTRKEKGQEETDLQSAGLARPLSTIKKGGDGAKIMNTSDELSFAKTFKEIFE